MSSFTHDGSSAVNRQKTNNCAIRTPVRVINLTSSADRTIISFGRGPAGVKTYSPTNASLKRLERLLSSLASWRVDMDTRGDVLMINWLDPVYHPRDERHIDLVRLLAFALPQIYDTQSIRALQRFINRNPDGWLVSVDISRVITDV